MEYSQICSKCQQPDPDNQYVWGRCWECTKENHYFLRDEMPELLTTTDSQLVKMAQEMIDAPEEGEPFSPRSLFQNLCLAEETGVEADWKGFAEMITRRDQ